MRLAIINLFLTTFVILLLAFVFRQAESLRFMWPAFELIKENLAVVIAGLVILIAVLIIYRSPHVRSR